MLKKNTLKRREFLTPMVLAGAGALLSGSLDSVQVLTRAMAATNSLGDVTWEDFTPLVGRRFRLGFQDGSRVRTTLIECNLLTSEGRVGGRQPFSIIFDVPAGVELSQGPYQIRNRQIGTLNNVFMVPVDPQSGFNRLEAIFD